MADIEQKYTFFELYYLVLSINNQFSLIRVFLKESKLNIDDSDEYFAISFVYNVRKLYWQMDTKYYMWISF